MEELISVSTGIGSNLRSCNNVLHVPSYSNIDHVLLQTSHQIGQHGSENSLDHHHGLAGFMFGGFSSGDCSLNVKDQVVLRTSDPKAASINQNIAETTTDSADNPSWLKSRGLDKGKKKMRRRLMREPRFSFQTRSDVDVLDDGYKWRKYGQKIVKNSLHPRSYFRCSHEKCRVKKRVERVSEDCRMVITTYEGRHTHFPSDDGTTSSHEELDCFPSF